MLILLDQDGVLADFEQGFYVAWNARMAAEFPAVALQLRRSFYVRDDYPAHYADAVQAIYTSPGFYRDLLPVAGALDAVKSLCDMGHDVRICTSPLHQYRALHTRKVRMGGAPSWHRLRVPHDRYHG